MSGLGERLEELGLSQYLDNLVDEGFDSWYRYLALSSI